MVAGLQHSHLSRLQLQHVATFGGDGSSTSRDAATGTTVSYNRRVILLESGRAIFLLGLMTASTFCSNRQIFCYNWRVCLLQACNRQLRAEARYTRSSSTVAARSATHGTCYCMRGAGKNQVTNPTLTVITPRGWGVSCLL